MSRLESLLKLSKNPIFGNNPSENTTAENTLADGEAVEEEVSPLLAFVVKLHPESESLEYELGRTLASFSGRVRAAEGEVRVLLALDPEDEDKRAIVEDTLTIIECECQIAEAERIAAQETQPEEDGYAPFDQPDGGDPGDAKSEADDDSNNESAAVAAELGEDAGGFGEDDEADDSDELGDESERTYPKDLWKFTPEICETNQLMELVAGYEYVMVVHQGASMGSRYSNQLLHILRAGKHDVIKTTRNRVRKSTRSSFRSSYYGPFRALLSANGVILRTSRVKSMDVFFSADRHAALQMIETVMDAGGYLDAQHIRCHRGPNYPQADPSIGPWFAEELATYSMKTYGEVTEYVQHCMASILYDEIKRKGSKEAGIACLRYIDDEVILRNGRYNLHSRLYALNLKHDTNVLDETVIEYDSGVYLDERLLFKINNASRLKICVTTVEDGAITLQGTTDLEMLGDRGKLLVTDNEGNERPLELSDYHLNNFYGLDEELVLAGRQFKVTVPLKVGQTFEIVYRDEYNREFRITPGMLRHSRFDPKNPSRYLAKDGFLIKLRDGVFTIEEHTKIARAKSEIMLQRNLVKRRKTKQAIYRTLHFAHASFQRKPIWILADRPQAAKDNAEHLFRYILNTDAARRNNVYFLLNANYPDYERVKQYGRVLKYGSLSHKLKFLESSFIISAAANNLATNAFGKSEPCYRDLYDFDFVYLRHGVSHNDQSAWLHKLRKDMRIIDATCKPEYEAILEGSYGYTEREVRLTGLPRFDNLHDDRQKIISILPTWRENLQGPMLPRTSERAYVPAFKESDYFKFYDALIHNERLLDVMREHGYTGVFYLHPALSAQYVDFESSELIEVGDGIADYQQIFAESAMMVTDYSSVAFDFAYLKKPVIYAQFDEESFYANHSWEKGYFTYRDDGFGPVTSTLDETVDAMIGYIENDCQMKPEHISKVEAFFAYTDRNNCKRVLDAIEEVERKKS